MNVFEITSSWLTRQHSDSLTQLHSGISRLKLNNLAQTTKTLVKLCYRCRIKSRNMTTGTSQDVMDINHRGAVTSDVSGWNDLIGALRVWSRLSWVIGSGAFRSDAHWGRLAGGKPRPVFQRGSWRLKVKFQGKENSGKGPSLDHHGGQICGIVRYTKQGMNNSCKGWRADNTRMNEWQRDWMNEWMWHVVNWAFLSPVYCVLYCDLRYTKVYRQYDQVV